MNKVFSVLKLYFRETVSKLIMILLLMTLSELILYFVTTTEMRSFAGLVEKCRIFYIYVIAFAAMTLFNSIRSSRKHKTGYTLQKIRISERAAFLLQCVADTVNVLIVYLWQIVIILILYRLYKQHGYQSAADIYQDFYISNTLTMLIPLYRKQQWVTNAVILLSAGAEAASIDVKVRYGQYVHLGIIALWPSVLDIHDPYLHYFFLRFILVVIDFCWAYQLTHNGKGRQ
ncbi:MAG: hypothetical protein IJG59_07000 [Erysipelotrichaceae bacterium]|nr:hypothetical protein [Erysipelotrichaceae bacterium]